MLYHPAVRAHCAQYAVVPAGHTAPIADGIEPPVAAVLASAISAMSMRTAAGLSAGETVLVQGATGVAGRLAVKIARLLGAGRIVATGRDDDALRQLAAIGADAVINTSADDADLVQAFRDHAGDGYDVVIDYLWGRPTELLTRALIPDSFAMPKATRLVQIGESAGPAIQLTADALRTSGLEIYGAARNMATGIAAAYQQVVDWVNMATGTRRLPAGRRRARRRTHHRRHHDAPQPDRAGVDPHRPPRHPPRHHPRLIGDPMNKLVSPLHDATHLVSGVPAHSDAPAVQRPHRTRVSPRLHKTGVRTGTAPIGTTKPRRASSSPGRTGSPDSSDTKNHR